MSFTISLTEKYQQREAKFLKRHPELKSAYHILLHNVW